MTGYFSYLQISPFELYLLFPMLGHWHTLTHFLEGFITYRFYLYNFTCRFHCLHFHFDTLTCRFHYVQISHLQLYSLLSLLAFSHRLLSCINFLQILTILLTMFTACIFRSPQCTRKSIGAGGSTN